MPPDPKTAPDEPPAHAEDVVQGRRSARCIGLAFPIALLLFEGLFFGGHLGWWTDDYWHNLRDPVTDQVTGLVRYRGFFLRPLFYVIVPALTTLLWHHDWLAHTLQIGAHGLVVTLLWRLMRMLGIGRPAAAAAALLFMVYPPQFEALYWFAALPTLLSSSLLLGVMMVALRWRHGSRWWRSVVMAVFTFAACCLNEQPASVVLAMPLVGWLRYGESRSRAAAPDDANAPEAVTWKDRAEMLIPTLACGLAAAVYVGLMRLWPGPAGVRGSPETLVALGDLPRRSTYFFDVLWRRLVMRNFAGGALREGWRQIVHAGPGAWAGLGVVVALGILWAWRRPVTTDADRPRRAVALVALGLIVFVAGWLPVLAVAKYDPDSRVRYWPDAGLAIVAAAAIDVLARRRRPVCRLALAGVLIAWSVMLVGAQTGFRNRWRMDQAHGAELVRLIPDPVPYTMFVPVNVDEQALQTGAPVLDTHFRSVWEAAWTPPSFIMRIYRRDDVRCGYCRAWTPGVPLRGAEERGIHYDLLGPRFERLPDGTSLIPWDRAIPFTIGRDHVPHVATRVRLQKAGQPDQVVPVPQARGLPEFELALPRP